MSRLRPASPLAQNTQPMAQPTWVEMQIVLREWSRPTPSCGARMMTVSMSEPVVQFEEQLVRHVGRVPVEDEREPA